MTNSIRPVVMASLLATGEAQASIVSGTPDDQGCRWIVLDKTDQPRDNEGWLETERLEGQAK